MFFIWFCYHFSLISSRYIRLSTINSSELSPIGTSIIQLIDFLPNSNWEFEFLSSSSLNTYFLLDNLKGTIILKRHLDRENFCLFKFCSCFQQCFIQLEINAISDISIEIFSLPILIIDENDHLCYFHHDIYFLNLTENLPINTRISLPFAYDPDLPPNNIQRYSLHQSNYSQFQLEINSRTPSMIITDILDREIIENYSLKFCAYEQQHSCCTDLIINIVDINDNSPEFSIDQRGIFVISLSELTPIGTEIVRMKASDIDQGLNGEIRYTFSKLTSINNQMFYLDSINGSIILLQTFDYEKQTNYQLQIQANDLGDNSIPTYTTINIQIIDENDCIPELFIFPSFHIKLTNNSLISIYENESLHTPLIYLTVSDGDTNENGRVSIELITLNSIVGLEKINNETYFIFTNQLFDREENQSFSFSLIIFDHGKINHRKIHKFSIDLIDINDCFPIFHSKTNSTYYIDENNQENILIDAIQVEDFDLNDRITLQIEFMNDNEKNFFILNEQNQLIVKTSFDYEYQSSYSLKIIAEDLIGHRTYFPIKIIINDLNDNPVKFHRNLTRFYLWKNHPIGIYFGLIQAKDNDKTNEIIYSIQSNNSHSIGLTSNGYLYMKERIFHGCFLRIIANDSLHIDSILIEIILENNSILINPTPLCFNNRTIQLKSTINVSFSIRNSSLSDLILFSNGTMNLPMNIRKYSFDVYLQDEDIFYVFKNFHIVNSEQCFIEFHRHILFIGLCALIIILIIIGFYIRQQMKIFDKNHEFLSSQFTAMTIFDEKHLLM